MKEYYSTRNFNEETLNKIFSTLKKWTEFIQNTTNFSFIKFGDGEFYCMMGEEGENCDHHPYSKELAVKLYDAWYFFNTLEYIYIAEWAGHKPDMNCATISERFQLDLISKTDIKVNFVNYEILLQNTLCEDKFNFLKSIKDSNRKKIFVGPNRLQGVNDFLNVDTFINIPLINTFAKYDEILPTILNEIEDNSIFLFSCGLPSKSFIHKILEKNNNVTCLDFGSGFDSMFVGHTREGQIDGNYVKNYYNL
jgi:hypothetical protein